MSSRLGEGDTISLIVVVTGCDYLQKWVQLRFCSRHYPSSKRNRCHGKVISITYWPVCMHACACMHVVPGHVGVFMHMRACGPSVSITFFDIIL